MKFPYMQVQKALLFSSILPLSLIIFAALSPPQIHKKKIKCAKPCPAVVRQGCNACSLFSTWTMGIFIMPVFLLALCLLLQLSLILFLSPFSCLIEGCRILQSGWWSSNSIYSSAQRPAERADEIVRGRGMETADVREHFLSAVEWQALGSRPDTVTSGIPSQLTKIICI